MNRRNPVSHAVRRLHAGVVALAGSALLALSACAPAPTADIGRISLAGPADASFGGQPIIGLGLGAGQPGRRLLPNATALPGENFISTTRKSGFGGFGFEGELRQAGPLPAPFEFAIARDFAPLGGGYSYISSNPEPGVACVLVIGSGGGYSPGTSTMMRNCVVGDVSDALAPLSAV